MTALWVPVIVVLTTQWWGLVCLQVISKWLPPFGRWWDLENCNNLHLLCTVVSLLKLHFGITTTITIIIKDLASLSWRSCFSIFCDLQQNVSINALIFLNPWWKTKKILSLCLSPFLLIFSATIFQFVSSRNIIKNNGLCFSNMCVNFSLYPSLFDIEITDFVCQHMPILTSKEAMVYLFIDPSLFSS